MPHNSSTGEKLRRAVMKTCDTFRYHSYKHLSLSLSLSLSLLIKLDNRRNMFEFTASYIKSEGSVFFAMEIAWEVILFIIVHFDRPLSSCIFSPLSNFIMTNSKSTGRYSRHGTIVALRVTSLRVGDI
jgi:hypothetical protein